jgi:hypothetical protein
MSSLDAVSVLVEQAPEAFQVADYRDVSLQLNESACDPGDAFDPQFLNTKRPVIWKTLSRRSPGAGSKGRGRPDPATGCCGVKRVVGSVVPYAQQRPADGGGRRRGQPSLELDTLASAWCFQAT